MKQDKKLRIRSVTSEGFDKEGGQERKLVLWFSNDDRGLVLNKSNNRTLRGAFDDDTANWVGKVIVVFPMMTEFRGKMVNALRYVFRRRRIGIRILSRARARRPAAT